MSKQPAILFYVGDWRKDLGIQSLSYHHRGIWLELLMLMHTSEQRGRLVLNDRPISIADMSRLLGLTEQECGNAISVLLASGVASRDQHGAIINRRMVREEERRDKLRENASKGGSKTQANREARVEYENENEGLEKVRGFARGEGILQDDADWFFWKCHANGWTNAGRPILDWKATLRSWKKAGYLPSQRVQKAFMFHKEPPRGGPFVSRKPRPQREPSDEEWEKSREHAQSEMKKFREKYGP